MKTLLLSVLSLLLCADLASAGGYYRGCNTGYGYNYGYSRGYSYGSCYSGSCYTPTYYTPTYYAPTYYVAPTYVAPAVVPTYVAPAYTSPDYTVTKTVTVSTASSSYGQSYGQSSGYQSQASSNGQQLTYVISGQPGHWIWQLQSLGGIVVAKSPVSFSTQTEAAASVELARKAADFPVVTLQPAPLQTALAMPPQLSAPPSIIDSIRAMTPEQKEEIRKLLSK